MPADPGALGAIGRTPLVQLNRIAPAGSALIVAKLEFTNPTGSMKDRVARAMIGAAEHDGRLPPNGTVVEYTSGTTGISLAFVCAATRHPLEIVFSDAFSPDKRATMEAFGARVTTVLSQGGGITEAVIRAMVARAGEIARRPGHWLCDQLNNRDGAAGYHGLGEELWQQTDGDVDAFVQGVGTGHCLIGTSEALRRHRTKLEVVAVEPAESPVLAGGATGAHRIEGIGIGYLPPLWDPAVATEIQAVSTDEAQRTARRLAVEEGLFAGTSSGANVAAAVRVARRLGPRATVATLLVDSGFRYLSTDLYRPPGLVSYNPSEPAPGRV